MKQMLMDLGTIIFCTLLCLVLLLLSQRIGVPFWLKFSSYFCAVGTGMVAVLQVVVTVLEKIYARKEG